MIRLFAETTYFNENINLIYYYWHINDKIESQSKDEKSINIIIDIAIAL